MNFKTFCFAALALLSVVNNAPLTNNTSSIDDLKKACKYGNSELHVKMNEDDAIYACVHKYNENKHNNIARPDNSVCFYLDNDVYCVDRRYTNIKECDKSSKNFDYRTCSYDILSLTNDGSERYTYRFRSYPDKERISVDAVQDQKECKARNGIVLTYNVMYQYICLYPETSSHSLKDKHCVGVDGKVYCVYEDNTIITTCNKHSKQYNHDNCMNILSEYSKANGVTVNEEKF
ncbi:hypothetical protein H8356DRAFT_1296946 [Neocallimastix lanati (nom. inval.)]|uniref:Uncharacterized protein n=1 Tax=Neocallimastix californiae TaxID=1754190 RepID=A0A1Y2AES6_9FUNG|nr:hypothetical protein H8356DRAFT_1296946 [Neocallimastix sp. JGI-2020a]ORY20944.1 hypothetical protein LY90DRAFT_146768 [Neocallimastix californiae]|eukprot:ORY20944.1 hypothetical protein LY90DRAFT_146768 [Neocallimastix californiae]